VRGPRLVWVLPHAASVGPMCRLYDRWGWQDARPHRAVEKQLTTRTTSTQRAGGLNPKLESTQQRLESVTVH
jgi:hypothetical protein